MIRLPKKQARVLLAFVLFGIVFSIVTTQTLATVVSFDPIVIRHWLQQFDAAAPVVYIALMVTAIVVPPIPPVPLDIASGLLFGLLWGSVFTLVGAEIGAVIAFLIARHTGRAVFERRLPTKKLTQLKYAVEKRGFVALLVMRLLPAFHFDWVSYAAGLSRISLCRFAAATLLGMIPPVIAIVAVGDLMIDQPATATALFGALALVTALPLAWWSISEPTPPAQQ